MGGITVIAACLQLFQEVKKYLFKIVRVLTHSVLLQWLVSASDSQKFQK
jgi:hypothetical protein